MTNKADDIAAEGKTVKPLTGRHVLIAIVLFFVFIIGINVVFILLATGSFTGEDVPKAYVQGVDYNRTLEARAAQQELDWRAALDARRDDDGKVVITLNMSDTDGPLERLDVEGILRRPTQAALDRVLTFEAHGQGRYEATVEGLEPGAWYVDVKAGRDASMPFEARSRVWLP